jgi:magnesium transporter
MADPLFGPELRLMLAEDDTAALKALCEDLHPARVAEAVDEFEPADIWKIIAPAPIRTQAAIFEYLPPPQQLAMVDADRGRVGQLITKMSHDDRVDLLRRLPGKSKEAVLRLVDEADRRDIATLFVYGEGTVGALMTTDYAWLPPTMSAAEAIDQLRQQAPDRETIYYVYVLDEPARTGTGGLAPRKLLGALSLRDLILAPRHVLIRDFMKDELITLKHTDDGGVAAELLAKYDFIAMPVVDDAGGMLGIITHDDVIDILQEEATEDLQRQGGVGPIEGNFLEAPFAVVWWSRAKWLAVLFVFQMATITVMRHYEGELEKVVFLMALVPLCLSVGGNAGSQAATLVTRALALGEISTADWLRVFRRELLIGLTLAASLALLAIIRTYFFTSHATQEKLAESNHPFTALLWLVPISVAGICFTGTLVGSMLPLGLKRIGMDPALTSSPFIATLSDVLGIVIFFNVAWQFFF